MGLRPCSLHGGRYRGPAQHCYPAMIAGVERVSRRHSLCPEEFQAIYEFAVSQMQGIFDSEEPVDEEKSEECISCGGPLDEFAVAFFVTFYPRGQSRVDYFGQAHPHCKQDVCSHLGLLHQGQLLDDNVELRR